MNIDKTTKRNSNRQVCACCACLLVRSVAVPLLAPRKASAQAGTAAPAAPPTSISLAAAAESLRTRLLDAQLAGDAVAGQAALESAHRQYMVAFAEPFAAQAPAAAQRIEAGFAAATQGIATGDQAAVAAAKATIWTGVLDGAYRALLAAVHDGETAAAQRWLQVREFSQATRFVRPGADATIALKQYAAGEVDASYVVQAIHADLLDAYQERLAVALQDVAAADARGFAARRAEAAAQAQGYFALLAPAYAEQRGDAAAAGVAEELAQLVAQVTAGESALTGSYAGTIAVPLQEVAAKLASFRAAPLSPAEQARRAAQLVRFLALVPVEYGRGVNGSLVTNGLEVSEAVAFAEAAHNAFADLQPALVDLDANGTARVAADLDALSRCWRRPRPAHP